MSPDVGEMSNFESVGNPAFKSSQNGSLYGNVQRRVRKPKSTADYAQMLRNNIRQIKIIKRDGGADR